MSIRAMVAVWEHLPFGGSTLVVALACADWAGEDGRHIYPRIDQLMRKSRCSRRTVLGCIEELEAAGVLVREASGVGRGNRGLWRIELDYTQWSARYIKGAESAPFDGRKRCKIRTKKVQNLHHFGPDHLTVIKPLKERDYDRNSVHEAETVHNPIAGSASIAIGIAREVRELCGRVSGIHGWAIRTLSAETLRRGVAELRAAMASGHVVRPGAWLTAAWKRIAVELGQAEAVAGWGRGGVHPGAARPETLSQAGRGGAELGELGEGGETRESVRMAIRASLDSVAKSREIG